nr:RING finger protein 24 isoform X2 [Kogia breviceps]XP_058894896.1 RING finger protein 24 isoform X2 [Kogia breviceps]XP_058894897.1 RING finger protein 24 isoform X2 [Kogia breviceps]
MSSDFPHYNFRMPNIGFQNLPLNIYIVVFGTAIFVFILSLLFCCYLIRLRHQAHKEFYAYKQVILKEKVKELNLHELCAVCLEDFKPRDELGICPCKHAFHRKSGDNKYRDGLTRQNFAPTDPTHSNHCSSWRNVPKPKQKTRCLLTGTMRQEHS